MRLKLPIFLEWLWLGSGSFFFFKRLRLQGAKNIVSFRLRLFSTLYILKLVRLQPLEGGGFHSLADISVKDICFLEVCCWFDRISAQVRTLLVHPWPLRAQEPVEPRQNKEQIIKQYLHFFYTQLHKSREVHMYTLPFNILIKG